MRSNLFTRFAPVMVATSALLLANCGKEEEKKEEDTVLKGTWTAACQDASAGSVEATNSQITVVGTRYEDDDKTCAKTAVNRVTAVYGYSIGGDAETPAGAKQIDLTVTSFKVVFLSSNQISALNSEKICGYSDWAVNVEKELSEAGCDEASSVTKAGSVWYNIFKIDADKLQVGNDSNDEKVYQGKTAETRVREYDGLVYTKS